MSKAPIVTCWFSEAEIKKITLDASASYPKETGGLLLGYWSDVNDVVVSLTTSAGLKSIKTRTTYEPDYDFDRDVVSEKYLESKGVTTYLGDWHSHPNGGSSLSYTDRKALTSIASSRSGRAKTPLMAIISGDHSDWKLGVWYKRPKRGFQWPEYSSLKIQLY